MFGACECVLGPGRHEGEDPADFPRHKHAVCLKLYTLMLDDLKHSGHRPLSVETLALLSSAVMEDGGRGGHDHLNEGTEQHSHLRTKATRGPVSGTEQKNRVL